VVGAAGGRTSRSPA